MARKSGPKNTEDENASLDGGVSAGRESEAADPFGDGAEGSARYGSTSGSTSGRGIDRNSDHDFDRDPGGMVDLEPEEQSPFLRSQKRVSVRRGPLPKKTANRLKIGLVLAAVGCVVAAIGFGLYGYARSSWRFRVDSSDFIRVTGNHNVTRAEIMEVFGGDISRNIFSVPLEERKKQLEQTPWIQSVTVMRLLPNRIAVDVHERTPVAFARVDSRVMLVDASGVLMEMPATSQVRYSFPVIEGFSEAEPLSTRAARMKIYQALMRDLDGGGARYSQDISDVDLGDPEDVRVTVADPNGEVLVHLGESNFLDRYKIYVSHIQEWRQEHARLRSVDLRYDHQIILNADPQPGDVAETRPAARASEEPEVEAEGSAPEKATRAADNGPAVAKKPAKVAKQTRAEAKKKQKVEKMKAAHPVKAKGGASRPQAPPTATLKTASSIAGKPVVSAKPAPDAAKPAVVVAPKTASAPLQAE
jgi:cell division protein FtsQ